MNTFEQDTFFEQIVPIKKTGKSIAAIIGIWLLAIALVFLLLMVPFLGTLNVLIIFGVGYGALKLTAMLNVEYEYIITNGTMDIDKITNKSSRKRILSFDLGNVTDIKKYNPAAAVSNANSKSVFFACDKNDPEAYVMIAEREGKGNVTIIFAPDNRLKSAIVKFTPKYISNSAFK